MNREIKFRGKRIDNGEWVYGYLADEDYINDIDSIDLSSIEVDRDTVGQFTGLFDKNGKEIFEGDILLVDDYEGVRIYNKVGIKDGCFGYIGEYSGDLLPFCHYNVSEEIAGNIYDNPELIKE